MALFKRELIVPKTASITKSPTLTFTLYRETSASLSLPIVATQMASPKPLDPRLVEVEFKNDFTKEELAMWRDWFVKVFIASCIFILTPQYDKNKSGELELFELNIMYEEMGTPKTHQQLKELIKEADTTNSGGSLTLFLFVDIYNRNRLQRILGYHP